MTSEQLVLLCIIYSDI